MIKILDSKIIILEGRLREEKYKEVLKTHSNVNDEWVKFYLNGNDLNEFGDVSINKIPDSESRDRYISPDGIVYSMNYVSRVYRSGMFGFIWVDIFMWLFLVFTFILSIFLSIFKK